MLPPKTQGEVLVKKSSLLVLTAIFVVACGESHPTLPAIEGMPSLAISDGASGGNSEFFFFPPLVEDPTGSPNFDEGAFNEYLSPFVRICWLNPTAPGECDAVADQSGNVDLPMVVDLTNEWYKVNWKTSNFALTADQHYRIQVWVGGAENVLGYRDVIPLDGPPVASCTSSDEYCNFNNGSTVPIKVRIEDGAFCPLVDGVRVECQTKSFDLTGGVNFDLHGTSGQFLLDVPPQPEPQQGTVTLQECADDNTADRIDLPTFGPCLEVVNLTPGFTGDLDSAATATVSFCDVDPSSFGLSPEQTANLRVHHFKDPDLGSGVEALRLANNCDFATAAAQPTTWVQRIASRVLGWVGPRPLSAAVATSGMGGNSLSGMRSMFKIALPSKIDFVNVSDATRMAAAGSPLATEAIVTDLNGDPVAGARVRWNVDSTGAQGADVFGSVSSTSAGCAPGPDDDIVCTTDASGTVQVSWLLAGDPGVNKLTAGGRGIADPRDGYNGPRDENYLFGPFDPFQPIGWAEAEPPIDEINGPEDETFEPLVWGTRILFTAIGCEEGYGTPNAIDGTMDPGEWDCASQESFPVNLSGGSTVDATLYYMNDDTNFYLAVVVPGAGRENALRIDWDANGNGNTFGREVGDDIWEFDPASGAADKFVNDKCSTSSQSGCGNNDEDWSGGNDTYAMFNNTGGATVYEMSHPLSTLQACAPVGGNKGCSSAFPIDLQASVGDSLGFFITLRLGSGAQGNTQWPGFLVYYPVTIK